MECSHHGGWLGGAKNASWTADDDDAVRHGFLLAFRLIGAASMVVALCERVEIQ